MQRGFGARRQIKGTVYSRATAAALSSATLIGCLAPTATLAGQFTASNPTDTIIDSRGLTLASSASYGRGVNAESFQTQTISTYGGYQYSAYWVNNSGSYYVALARRATGSSSWSVLDLTGSAWANGGNPPADAHNVVSFGIDQKDGTIHLAYDMHGNTLRYRVSSVGAATASTWSSSLFPTAEQNYLVSGGGSLTTVTYPMFVNTPSGDMQLFYRYGGSGAGSFFAYDYNGTTHTWGNGRQIDDGFSGTYYGTKSNGSANRNNYPNGYTYGSDGKLYSTFTWRENATGIPNHDMLFTYSDDGGNTWKNNSGQVIGSASAGTKITLNSPGLVVRPVSENESLMNQNSQAVDSANHIHALVWHRDPAKTAPPDGTWDPQESSYFQYWRDNLGNWHQNKLPGNVGQRPHIYFDANDNAYAIYQVPTGGSALSSGNIYVTNGDLVIAAASKASNWTDWKIIKTQTGPYVCEGQADAALFKSTGVLSVFMQSSPTLTTAQATNIHSLDFSIALTAPTTTSFNVASGSWSTSGNWSGGGVPGTNTVVNINGGRTAVVNSAVTTLDNVVAIGTGGSSGILGVTSSGSLNLLSSGLYSSVYGGSIIVGRDNNSSGAYNQSGGTVSAWRFAVGDYFNETTGGGLSSATISGGTLTTYELNVGFSATGSSSGSSFNVTGGTVTINGDAIIGEFGNSATLSLSGSGKLTVAGDIREGFNGNNNGVFRMDGGTLDLTGNAIKNVERFIYNGGALSNIGTIAGNGSAGITATAIQVAPNASVATALTVPASVRLNAVSTLETFANGTFALGTSAAACVGSVQTYTGNQVNVTTGGVVAGDGVVTPFINNTGGAIKPGHSGVSAGVFRLSGGYTQGAGGSLEVELGGTTPGAGGYDQLAVTGAASLAGALNVKRLGTYIPLPGSTYDVLTFSSYSGDVTLSNQTGFAGLWFTKTFSANKLTITAAANGGDANLDGMVDVTDLGALATNWQTSANWLGGDFNGDSFVDVTDLGILATNWQLGVPASSAIPLGDALAAVGLGGASVPEPASLASLGVALASLAATRSLRRRTR